MAEQMSLMPECVDRIEAYSSLDECLEAMNINENENIYNTACKCWYTVQEHKKIMCSISGGYDSDIILDLIVRCGGRERTTFVFNDTGLEYNATKEHLKYLESRYGVQIKRLSPQKAIPTCCREYGVPFWSKYVSSMIYRLQKHGFRWEDEPLKELLSKYPRCRSALRWWCNDFKTENGQESRFNIAYVNGLKEFMQQSPPEFRISSKCCDYSKKMPAHKELESGAYDLNITGVRKKEGGTRSSAYKSCYDDVRVGPDNYRPLFWWTGADKEVYRKHFGIIRSDCYELWGMDRTGCAGCPFGKDFENELDLVCLFEPKKYRAMEAVFGQSYAYTRKFWEYRERRKRLGKSKEQILLEGFYD